MSKQFEFVGGRRDKRRDTVYEYSGCRMYPLRKYKHARTHILREWWPRHMSHSQHSTMLGWHTTTPHHTVQCTPHHTTHHINHHILHAHYTVRVIVKCNASTYTQLIAPFPATSLFHTWRKALFKSFSTWRGWPEITMLVYVFV